MRYRYKWVNIPEQISKTKEELDATPRKSESSFFSSRWEAEQHLKPNPIRQQLNDGKYICEEGWRIVSMTAQSISVWFLLEQEIEPETPYRG